MSFFIISTLIVLSWLYFTYGSYTVYHNQQKNKPLNKQDGYSIVPVLPIAPMIFIGALYLAGIRSIVAYIIYAIHFLGLLSTTYLIASTKFKKDEI